MADSADEARTRPEEAEDGLGLPRRTWAATAIWLAIAMSILDQSLANVALPTIADQLGTTPEGSIWVVNAYQIAIVMTLLPVAALGEILGYRVVYLSGLALFVVASLSCTVAGSLTALSVSRFVQGCGAAALMGVNGAMVRFTYPRAILGRGIGYNSLVIAVGSASGPSIAAVILSIASWRWLFAINLPLGILAIAMGMRALPRVAPKPRRFDWAKAFLNAAAFAALSLGATGLAHGWGWPLATAEITFALVAFALLFRLSARETAPLIPVDLLRVRLLRLSYATSTASFGAQSIAFVSLPFLFLARFGFAHTRTGLLLTPWPLATAVAALIAGRLVERVSAATLGSVGLAATGTGLLALAIMPPGTPVPALVAATGLSGFGFGLFQTPNNRTMLGQAPASRSGAAAGMLATARLVGQTTGAIVVALLFRLLSPASALPLFVAAGLAMTAAALSARRAAL